MNEIFQSTIMKVFQKTVSSPLKLGKGGGFLFLQFGQRGGS